MIEIDNKQDCSGCSACYAVCAKDAITMKEDALGFKYPLVDTQKCVGCSLCEKVCAFNGHYSTPENLDTPLAFGARQKDIKEVDNSRSGGIFAALSDVVLSEGGVVYGAGYDFSFRVVHKRATTSVERDELRGSKYVQSDMGDVFRQVIDDLKEGRKVLFSGTPCQTAGLTSLLRLKKINRDNLLVCDIVCHGVPSPFIWKDYLKYIEEKEGKKIIDVNFRDKKKFGWKAHKESYQMEDANAITADTFTYIFYRHIMFRRSCEVCHYTNLRRTGDITLADFWGWQKSNPTANNDDRGLSLLLINTKKGISYFDRIHDRITSFPVSIENALQPNLQHPSIVHPKRMQFENDYERYGFKRTMVKYALMGWRYDVNIFVRRVIRFVKSRIYR